MAFTHLHVHTEYSLLDGSNKIKDYVQRLKELGMTAGAITDHGVMYGCMDFYKECLAQGIKPILGCEAYVSPGSRFDKGGFATDDRYYHLVLLAETTEGYYNLCKIVSAGFTEGFYYKPRIDREVLREYHEGIIGLSACLAGEIPRHITMGDYAGAKKAALELADIFGPDHFYLELQDHGIPEQRHVDQQLIRLHEETGLPLVATNDCHYTREEDWEAHDVLLCIQTQKKVQDEDRMRYQQGQYYVKSEEEMRALFSYCPEACDNTARIAERCNVNIVFGERKIPKYDCPDGLTSWEYLQKLCAEGFAARYPNAGKTEKERLAYELNTIKSMGFVDYFLIVWDYVHYAKSHGIIVGPGRGSAAGSIVSYCLDITELDPLKYDLIFERFLNPERVTMPDIDVDFCFEHRQDVIDYVVRKYGRERVVQIVTFGTMAARAVIRDVGRALDMPYSECDRIAKMVPKELNITLDKALVENPDFQKEYQENENTRHLIDMARKLEGLPRNTSMHAAGVVICGRPVVDYVPLSRAQDGSITTQYTMTTLEELGLLKMDFLGLRTLTVLQNAERLVNRSLPDGKKLDLRKINLSDPGVLDMIGRGKCEGVFQLESAGMKSFMKELKPGAFEDIIAGIALYRPGPMDFIPRYIEGKQHPESVKYDCPEIEPILKSTYGCIVYQEQVMQIVRDLAGYSMGRSDLVRRAMSKKKASVMAEERQKFIYGDPASDPPVPGCVKRGIDETVAGHIYDEMTDFAKYAFNKSHAAAYAVITMQTAYLKCYYPVEYMAALLTSVIDNPGKCAEYLMHCRATGIKILPPSVNEGEGRFTAEYAGKTDGHSVAEDRFRSRAMRVENARTDGTSAGEARRRNNAIRCGMYAIKSVGRGVIDSLVKEREEHGRYTSLQDFITRTYGKDMNKRAIENLIKAGALDCLGGTRKQFMQAYPKALDQAEYESKESVTGQMSLFDFMRPEEKKAHELRLPEVGEFSRDMLLSFEKEVLGIYLSGHPLEDYMDVWKARATAQTSDFALDEETGVSKFGAAGQPENIYVTVGGLIAAKTVKFTKNNQVMAFVTIEDLVGTVEVIVFPKAYEKYKSLLEEDERVFAEGRVSVEDDKPSKLILERMYRFSEVPRELWIAFPDKAAYLARKNELDGLIAGSGGIDRVIIFLRNTKQYCRLPESQSVTVTPDALRVFGEEFGDGNVSTRVSPRPRGRRRY